MPCRIRDAGSVSILDIDGGIDINSSDIIETVGWLIDSNKLSILCNLENVDMVDYNGLSILAIAYKNVINHKGKMKFMNVPLQVMELFRVVRLDMVFECYFNETAAISSFSGDGAALKAPLRRRFQRLDIHLKVRYNLTSGSSASTVFQGDVLNISGAGLFMSTKDIFPINSPLLLTLNLPNEAKPISTPGRVIWLPDDELQPHSYPGMGVAFTHLDKDAEIAIVNFVEKNVSHRAEET